MIEMNDPKKFDHKIYFKAKIDAKGEPYFTSQELGMNSAKHEDIINIVNKYCSNERQARQLIDGLSDFIVPTKMQLRLAGLPTIFKQCVWEEDYEQFRRGCEKMSKSSMIIKDKNNNEKEWPIAMFSLYVYYN
jgi:hypothetical protein